MSTVISYFSATGNSLYVAKTLAGRLDACDLVSMPAALREAAAASGGAARVGLVFPLHYFGLPPLVARFVDQLDLSAAHYVFAVVTCGSASLSGALHQLKGLLAKRGRRLNAGFHLPLISSYIPLAPLPSPDNLRRRLTRAEAKLQDVAALIAAEQGGVESEYFWPFCLPVNNYWHKRVAGADRKFRLSAGCSACGRCVKVCPADNICLVAGRPEWRHRCQECLACLHICPDASIEFGARTQGRTRYHHPGVTIQEIIAANGHS